MIYMWVKAYMHYMGGQHEMREGWPSGSGHGHGRERWFWGEQHGSEIHVVLLKHESIWHTMKMGNAPMCHTSNIPYELWWSYIYVCWRVIFQVFSPKILCASIQVTIHHHIIIFCVFHVCNLMTYVWSTAYMHCSVVYIDNGCDYDGFVKILSFRLWFFLC